jgi:hypothetical protein
LKRSLLTSLHHLHVLHLALTHTLLLLRLELLLAHLGFLFLCHLLTELRNLIRDCGTETAKK